MWLLLYPRWHVSYFLGRVGSVYHGRPIPGPTLLTKPRRAGGGEHRALPPGAWHCHRHHRHHHHHHHHHLIIMMIITRAPVAPQVGRRTLTPCSAIPSDSRGSPTSYNRSSGGILIIFLWLFFMIRSEYKDFNDETILRPPLTQYTFPATRTLCSGRRASAIETWRRVRAPRN